MQKFLNTCSEEKDGHCEPKPFPNPRNSSELDKVFAPLRKISPVIFSDKALSSPHKRVEKGWNRKHKSPLKFIGLSHKGLYFEKDFCRDFLR